MSVNFSSVQQKVNNRIEILFLTLRSKETSAPKMGEAIVKANRCKWVKLDLLVSTEVTLNIWTWPTIPSFVRSGTFYSTLDAHADQTILTSSQFWVYSVFTGLTITSGFPKK